MKFSDILLQTATKVLAFIILTFSIYILFAGHNSPGGGFIGGLITSSAFVLLYIAFDTKTIHEAMPVDFKLMAAVGVLIALLTGIGSFLFDVPFLTHTFASFNLPLFGHTELATAVLFDLGVYLTVVGTTMTIILSISEDD